MNSKVEPSEEKPADPSVGPIVHGLGEKLRTLRRERNLSLTQVADATGISSSFLSLVENEKSDLTVARLVRLVSHYGVTVTDLLPESDDGQPEIVRHGQQRKIRMAADHMALLLLVTEGGDRAMMPVIGAYEVGGGMSEFVSYDSEQFDYVLEGTIKVVFEHEPDITLSAGDSAYYSAKRPHRYQNVGDVPARAFHIRSPGA